MPEKTRKKFDEEEIRGFEEDFAAFDLDGSGAIDERELMLCFKDMKIEIDGKRLRKLLASVDEDGSGELEFDEFFFSHKPTKEAEEEDAKILLVLKTTAV